jgi:hypothetical protein
LRCRVCLAASHHGLHAHEQHKLGALELLDWRKHVPELKQERARGQHGAVLSSFVLGFEVLLPMLVALTLILGADDR